MSDDDRPDGPVIDPQGHLHQNIVHFGRLLRRAGLPVGPSHTVDAIHAIDAVGIGRRDDFFWALHAVFVRRRDQFEVFTQAFDLFWRDPYSMNKALALLLPHSQVPDRPPPKNDFLRRVQDAFQSEKPRVETPPSAPRDEELVDMRLTFSDAELLRSKDFDQMSADEIRRARTLIKRMRLSVLEIRTRRHRPSPRGRRIDMRRTLKATLRAGGKPSTLSFQRPHMRPSPL
ncbi:MAG: VWA domain-containing protein, partial [Myxococcota bacterium]